MVYLQSPKALRICTQLNPFLYFPHSCFRLSFFFVFLLSSVDVLIPVELRDVHAVCGICQRYCQCILIRILWNCSCQNTWSDHFIMCSQLQLCCTLNATIKTVLDCPANMADLKVVLVGPPGTGKSSMIHSLTTNTFKTVHSPTAFDNYTAKIEDGQKTYQLR